jgi:sugar O-acyltransferase (sialic acid O-acetyltransferase NeuD family)
MTLYGIVGAGGCGREVMPVAVDMLQRTIKDEPFEVVFVVEGGGGSVVNGCRVLSDEEYLNAHGTKFFNVAIAAHGPRERIANKLGKAGCLPFSIQASNSINLGPSTIGEGAIICPFSSIGANATIGKFFHSNVYSYVAHDCIIGDFVTFAPNVMCCGRVTIEDYAYIGAGACIRQGTDQRPMVIGRGAVVGMGAVVTRSVAPDTTVAGNPAGLLARRTA